MSKTVFFSVGEPSGDQHAARLIRSLSQLDPEIRTRGFGGMQMRNAGCAVDLDLTEHAVFGLLEVLPKLREFFQFADDAEEIFAAGGIDAVVLVDFPGFNWHIAKRAKKYGIPVYYYCPPQLWAWAGWRIKKMKATVDHVLAVLPIEEQYFGGHGIPTTFVGHPFFDAVGESQLDEGAISSLESAAQGTKTVAVLPGSRTHEVHRNWPIMLRAISRLSESNPELRFAVAAYRERHRDFCQSNAAEFDSSLPIDFYLGVTSEVIEYSHCAMMVSGSVSLEMMARKTPAAVIYRVGRFLYGFAKCVVKVDSMTLPNLMPQPESLQSAERVFPEVLSVGNPEKATEFLASTVRRMVNDQAYHSQKVDHLQQLRDRYARLGASDRAAAKVLELLHGRSKRSSAVRAA